MDSSIEDAEGPTAAGAALDVSGYDRKIEKRWKAEDADGLQALISAGRGPDLEQDDRKRKRKKIKSAAYE